MKQTEKTLSAMLDRSTCTQCREKTFAAPQNEHGWSDLGALYECGAVLDVSLGHIYVATNRGKTALCIVSQRH